jgi:hypothetical protein
MTYERPNLEILEIDYSVSPEGINEFEVYDTQDIPMSPPLFSSTDLTEAVKFCYDLGQDFTVRTIAQWEREQTKNV